MQFKANPGKVKSARTRFILLIAVFVFLTVRGIRAATIDPDYVSILCGFFSACFLFFLIWAFSQP